MAVTLDAIASSGNLYRGVAVVEDSVSDAELLRLHDGGIRGIRFTVANPATAVVSVDMIEPLSKRIAALGWHVQINMEADEIAENAEMFKRLPSQIVFDHLGKLPPAIGVKHPAFGVIRGLIDAGKAWVKISGAYMNTEVGPPTYSDATAVAQAYVEAAPERLVWGSDWPHPSPKEKPDDAVLFDLLTVWAPDEATRNRILVENPCRLYGFPSS